MFQPSQTYANQLSVMEGIEGQVPGNPGHYSWYYDNIGVATLGYGYALIDSLGVHIRKGEPNANARADAAVMKLFPGGTTISRDQAVALKLRTMAVFAAGVSPLVRLDTTQAQFDALVDFSYNVGVGALKTSSLLRLHNAKAVSGDTNLHNLAVASQKHTAIVNIGEAFAAYSNADHSWSKGVFHRRMWEFLIYDGADYAQAYSTSFAFQS